ncbi:hypothetical protein GCM10010129_48200 [Streptomyces fumigatiscleroticus]|nr:hypothetical protein GCM10010129_48200 [Streptomyces fumigatiscleroticus]
MLVCMASNQQTRPGIGEPAEDRASGRIGVVMGKVGGRVQMRPTRGGVEWEAMPDNVVALSAQEAANARQTSKSGSNRGGL